MQMDLNIKTPFLFLSPFFTHSSSSHIVLVTWVGILLLFLWVFLREWLWEMTLFNSPHITEWKAMDGLAGDLHSESLIFLKWCVWHNFVETLWGHHLPQRATGSELGDTSCYSTFTMKWLCGFSGCQCPHLQSEGLDITISKNTFGFYSPWSVVRSGLISSTCPFFLLWPRGQHSNKLEPAEICHRFALACSHTFIFFTGAI